MDKLGAVISKSLVQSHRQCPRRAWIEAHGAAEPDHGVTGMAMLEQGMRVHEAARAARPGATLIPTHVALSDAAVLTAQAMAEGATVIGEAVFVADGLGVRVDVLECGSDGLHMVEVKSGGGLKDEYLDDAAIQHACVERAGHRVASVSIEHPSLTRILSPGEPAGSVLVRETVTDLVAARSVRVAGWVRDCASTLHGAEPDVNPGKHCSVPHVCPFSERCGKVQAPTDTDLVDFLPSKAGKVKDCIDGGFRRIGAMPAGAFTHPRNALVREAVLRGVGVVRARLADRVAALPYPRAFVDFETASPALPLHVGMRPFEPIAFQWSCHTVSAPQAQAAHSWFLDTSGADPRRQFAESVLEALGNAACVAVFSGYEARVLSLLGRSFPDLSDRIEAVRRRMVDLLPLARRGYYHPDQRGSWSLKAILPTLPGAREAGLDYGDLSDVADGMQAQAAYLALIGAGHTRLDDGERARLRAELVRYCGIDTAGLLHFARHVESCAG